MVVVVVVCVRVRLAGTGVAVVCVCVCVCLEAKGLYCLVEIFFLGWAWCRSFDSAVFVQLKTGLVCFVRSAIL